MAKREYPKPGEAQSSFLKTVAFRYLSKSRNFYTFGLPRAFTLPLKLETIIR